MHAREARPEREARAALERASRRPVGARGRAVPRRGVVRCAGAPRGGDAGDAVPFRGEKNRSVNGRIPPRGHMMNTDGNLARGESHRRRRRVSSYAQSREGRGRRRSECTLRGARGGSSPHAPIDAPRRRHGRPQDEGASPASVARSAPRRPSSTRGARPPALNSTTSPSISSGFLGADAFPDPPPISPLSGPRRRRTPCARA